jgi:hypothetical protein
LCFVIFQINACDAKTSADFSIIGAQPCDLLATDDISQVLGIEKGSINSSVQRNKDDKKICRYEMKNTSYGYVALIVVVNYNDRQDVRPNQYSKRMAAALSDGLPVMGFADRVQLFKKVDGLGTEAGYSDNMPDNKNLLLRLGEDYLINLELSYSAGNKGIPNVQDKLVTLANKLLN